MKQGHKLSGLRSLKKALKNAHVWSTKDTQGHEGKDGMNNTVAVEKEKVEKRRALGRGLESLLPGPRVVQPAAVPSSSIAPGQSVAGKQQVPPLRVAQGQNDSALPPVEGVRGTAIEGVIQAVAQEAVDEAVRAPHASV